MNRNLTDDAFDHFRNELEKGVRVTPPNKIVERGARMRRTERARRGAVACAMLTLIVASFYLMRRCGLARS